MPACEPVASIVPSDSDGVARLTAAAASRPVAARNRRWLLAMLVLPLLVAAAAVYATSQASGSIPQVPPLSVPRGFRAITDPYFGYAIPASYHPNANWTDTNGDTFYGSPGAFVAETISARSAAPTASTRPPATFAAFGERRATAYSLSGGHPVSVPNAQFAYEVHVSRPGGWHAVAVDTWLADSSTQMWLLVRSPAVITQSVIGTLRGS